MKTILVVRHAKSSWANVGQRDFDRPLNDRGHRDAPVMATRLLKTGIKIQAFISSPAVRAFTTAQYFAETFGLKKKDIITLEALYHAPSETFYDIINHGLNDSFDTVAIFSHNPGITYFVNSLGLVSLDNMPTCAVFGASIDSDSWKDFEKLPKEFLLFDYPKK